MRQYFSSMCLVVLCAGFSSAAAATSTPSGWASTDTGIVKGTSKVTIGEVQDLKGQTQVDFVKSLENTVPNGSIFKSSGGLKDGKYVIQVKREISIKGDVPARSVLMLCKSGKNENRLIEIFTENSKVLDLISGGKFAISTCAE